MLHEKPYFLFANVPKRRSFPIHGNMIIAVYMCKGDKYSIILSSKKSKHNVLPKKYA